jgi:hypothetical protein
MDSIRDLFRELRGAAAGASARRMRAPAIVWSLLVATAGPAGLALCLHATGTHMSREKERLRGDTLATEEALAEAVA